MIDADQAGMPAWVLAIALLAPAAWSPALQAAPQAGGEGVLPDGTRENGGKFVPSAGRTLLIIGQDLQSISDYTAACEQCPPPAGVTAYLGFYNLLDARRQFGGLGQDAEGEPAPDADWGAGATNAARLVEKFPHSALVLGLDISNSVRQDGLAETARGEHDDKIARLTRFCSEIDRPVYLRIGYEFDGTWNRGYEDRDVYVSAFRRIVDVMRSRGAANVAFVWQASASPIDDVLEDGVRERISDWYPGARYVDWIALSWFLRPDEGPLHGERKPPTQRQLAAEVLTFARGQRKPVMIAESTPQGYDLAALSNANLSPVWDGPAGTGLTQVTAGDIWREWYKPLFAFIEANRDVVRAFAYINARWDDQPMWAAPYASGYWGDSRIQANAVLERRWTDELRREIWLHGSPTSFTAIGYPLDINE